LSRVYSYIVCLYNGLCYVQVFANKISVLFIEEEEEEEETFICNRQYGP